jgi:hypothetical protein
VRVLGWVAAASAVLMALVGVGLDAHWPALAVFAVIQLLALVSTPTWSLMTSAVLAGVADAKREFGPIRAAGTVGWMVGCVLIGVMGADASTNAAYLGSLFWGVVAVVSRFVPAAEMPASEGHLTWRERLGLDALELLKIRDHRLVFLTAALMTAPLSAFYPFTPAQLRDLGFERTSAWMALAQVTEIVAMFGLGTVFARYRLKWILATGLGFALLRYVLLAQNTPVTVLVGVTLHGFAYTLFFVAVPIYLNERIEARWRGRAQALLSLMNQGLGGVVGFLGTGYWLSLCRAPGGTRWPLFWGVLAVVVALVFLNFLINYQGRKSGEGLALSGERRGGE